MLHSEPPGTRPTPCCLDEIKHKRAFKRPGSEILADPLSFQNATEQTKPNRTDPFQPSKQAKRL